MTRVLCINPGSTSSKIAIFDDSEPVLRENITHTPEELVGFTGINDQLEYRKQTILNCLDKNGIALESVDGFAARGGGLEPHPSGTYLVNEIMVEQARGEAIASHPAQLAVQIAYELSEQTGKPAFMTDSPSTEEVRQIAKITGIRDVIRLCGGHALNQREVARRYALSVDKQPSEINVVVCHLGGGISVAAHEKGRMVDVTNNITGEGPMTPNRSGALSAYDVVDLCFQPGTTKQSARQKLTRNSGLLDHLGTDDVREVVHKITRGDTYAKNVYDAMIYQTAKAVGEMVAALKGRVDAIVLTGGIAHEKYFCEQLESYVCGFAPVAIMAGEFEMEALASGAISAIENETAKHYPPKDIWSKEMLHTFAEHF